MCKWIGLKFVARIIDVQYCLCTDLQQENNGNIYYYGKQVIKREIFILLKVNPKRCRISIILNRKTSADIVLLSNVEKEKLN